MRMKRNTFGYIPKRKMTTRNNPFDLVGGIGMWLWWEEENSKNYLTIKRLKNVQKNKIKRHSNKHK